MAPPMAFARVPLTASAGILLLSLVLSFAAASPASAAACVRPPPGPLDDVTEPDDAFGFIDGSAISSPCDHDMGSEITARFGKPDGSYRGVNSKIETSWTPAPQWQFTVALWHAYHSIRNNTVPGFPNQERPAFDGLATQVAYQFRERGTAPFDPGFSVGVEYRWARFSEGVGVSAERFAVTLKSAVDMAIYADRLYGAVNFNIGPGTERPRFTPGYVNDSGLELGSALNYRLSSGGRTFVGVNGRYVAAYSGAFLNTWVGHAVYAGPTFFHEFGTVGPIHYAFMSLSWNAQVWGRAAGGVTGNLDLVNFERHQIRLRLGGTL